MMMTLLFSASYFSLPAGSRVPLLLCCKKREEKEYFKRTVIPKAYAVMMRMLKATFLRLKSLSQIGEKLQFAYYNCTI